MNDLLQLMREAISAKPQGKVVFWMSPRVYRALRRAARRKLRKRRARYNRGKMGVRPRHRFGR